MTPQGLQRGVLVPGAVRLQHAACLPAVRSTPPHARMRTHTHAHTHVRAHTHAQGTHAQAGTHS